MSIKAFERSFTKPLLAKLRQEKRLQVESQIGQLIVLADINAFINVAERTLGIKIDKSIAEIALQDARIQALNLQKVFERKEGSIKFKRKFNAIIKKIPLALDIDKYELGRNIFIVTNFTSSILNIKKTILDSLQRNGAFTTEEQDQLGSQVHRGHGEQGDAISLLQVASTVSKASDTVRLKQLENSFNTFIAGGNYKVQRTQKIQELFTKYSTLVTTRGALRADYFSIVSFQEGTVNVEEGLEEKAIKSVFRRFVKQLTPKLLKMEGSSSIKDKVEKVVVDKITIKKTKSTKVKLTPKKRSVKLKSSGRVTKKNPGSKSKVSGRIKATPSKAVKAKKAKAGPSVFSLIALINQVLPEVVIKNMVFPKLQNRTGRFAHSVRVVDVRKTPKGFPSFGFTYMKQPYQVFETGLGTLPWATPEREPRRLIDQSIREVAKTMAIGRFFTRRL